MGDSEAIEHPVVISAEKLMTTEWMLVNAIEDYETLLKVVPGHGLYVSRLAGCKRALSDLQGAKHGIPR